MEPRERPAGARIPPGQTVNLVFGVEQTSDGPGSTAGIAVTHTSTQQRHLSSPPTEPQAGVPGVHADRQEENYFRYARTWFALDALDSYAAGPDDPDRLVPSPAKRAAAARIRAAERAPAAAEAARDAALLTLRSPAPGTDSSHTKSHQARAR